MKIKNAKVYVGTIKECLDVNNYKRNGDSTFIPEMECGNIQMGFSKSNTKEINNQAILIKTKTDNVYEFKLTNTFLDNLKILFDLGTYSISKEPDFNGEIFYVEKTLTPYYEEQPKKLTLRKLRKDLLLDPRIKSGIEH